MSQFSTTLTNIRRSPYQNLAAMLLLIITFFVAYSFSLFLYSTQRLLQYFETRPQIIAFFDLDATQDQINQTDQTMKSKDYVEGTTVVSKEQALQIYQETNKEDPLLLELVTADILPASIEVSGRNVEALPTIKADLEAMSQIDEVVFQQNVIDSLKSWTRSVRYIGLAAIAILGITSFLNIMVLTAMKISNKRNTINIMRMIGATRWYIKAPYFYEGILYGLVSSLLGWALMYVGLLYLTPWLQNFLGTIPLLPFPPQLFAIQLGVGTLIGVFLTGTASTIAVQRVMRK